MKANEAPEKIYMNWVNYPLEEMQVEYVRADAFIEKAKKWFEEYNEWFDFDGVRHCDLEDFEDFKNFMEGE